MTTYNEVRQIDRIVEKYANYMQENLAKTINRNKTVDLLCRVHSVNPLRLVAMATGEIHHIIHDVAGIERYFDTTKQTFRECFSPRYTDIEKQKLNKGEA